MIIFKISNKKKTASITLRRQKKLQITYYFDSNLDLINRNKDLKIMMLFQNICCMLPLSKPYQDKSHTMLDMELT